MQNDVFLSGLLFYPESVLLLYKDYQGIYDYSNLLIHWLNRDLSTKNRDVNYYYYIYKIIVYNKSLIEIFKKI